MFHVILLNDFLFLFVFVWIYRLEKEEKCYRCLFIAQKHTNVLQYKECKFQSFNFLFLSFFFFFFLFLFVRSHLPRDVMLEPFYDCI